MAKVHVLRALVEQRLSAAVEEVFVLIERTIAGYEEELCRSEQENQRQRKLLEAVLNPQVLLQRTDDQQLQVESEELSPEQQEWGSSLDQEDPAEPPYIKEEQEEELWTSQEGEQLQGLEEAKSTNVTYATVLVKSEDDEEEYPQSSQLRQSWTEDKGAEPPTSSYAEHVTTDTDGEDCGETGPELDPDLEKCLGRDRDAKADGSSAFIIEIINDEDNDEKKMEDLNIAKNNGPSVAEVTGKNTKRSFSCSVCGKIFGHERGVRRHMVSHRERPHSCSVCGKTFGRPTNLKVHMVTHTEEKPFSCFACGKTFKYRVSLKQHMTLHTDDILAESFKCSICGKTFFRKDVLKTHMITHTGEKTFSCSQCGKTFGRKTNLKAHMRIHTGEKRYSCNVCHKRFTWHHQVKSHQCVGHSAECGRS